MTYITITPVVFGVDGIYLLLVARTGQEWPRSASAASWAGALSLLEAYPNRRVSVRLPVTLGFVSV